MSNLMMLSSDTLIHYKAGLRELGILPFQTERLKTNQHGEREHKFALLNINLADYIRHIVSNCAAACMKHIKPCQWEDLSQYRAGGPVWREYLHDAGMAGKTKATVEGSPVKIREIKRLTNNATSEAGIQSVTGKKFWWSYSRSLFPSGRDFHVYTPSFGRLYVLMNCSIRNVFTLSSLRFCAISRLISWINHSSGSGMVYPLLTGMRRSIPHYGADSDYSDSLALRRWRRLISPRMAVFINCPVLSPSSFTFSMPSIISWAIRAVTDCDFAFFGPVAMFNPSCFRCKTIYTEKKYFEGLTCKTPQPYIVSYTLSIQGSETAKPVGDANTNGPLTTTDSKDIEAAMLNHTTHPQGRDSHNLNYPLLLQGYTPVFRTNFSRNTSDHLSPKAVYTDSIPYKTGIGRRNPFNCEATNDARSVFFSASDLRHINGVVYCAYPCTIQSFHELHFAQRHQQTMVMLAGLPKGRPESLQSGIPTPASVTALCERRNSSGDVIYHCKEAATMATTPDLVHSQTAFIWRFITVGTSERQIIHVTAWTEREARNRCPSGCVAVFAAKIRQEASHG
ncbi:host cell division inhibitor Icd-like protein [Escherichia coli]|nr:host cell division inhibitor Icd-like protein [Escherichia coli]